MNKKTLLFFITVLLIIFLLLIFFVFLNNLKPSSSPVGNTETSPAPIGTGPSQKIIVSGVKTNNFLSHPVKTNTDGDAIIAKTNGYQIVYLKKFSQFIINISTPSADTRNQAEEELLKTLGITKREACRLKVTVSSPYVPNPNLSLPRKTLSFCVNY